MLLHVVTTPTDPRVDLVAAIIFTLMSVGFSYLGFRLLRNPEPVSRFYASITSRAIGRRTARRFYSGKNLKVAGVGFVILGPLFFVCGSFAIWQMAILVFGQHS